MSIKSEHELQNETHHEIKEPKMYRVVLLNDDYTGMDFVVEVLMQVFHHKIENAINIMLKVHREGRGVCGVYTHEIAETKVSQVKAKAKENEFPLRADMEREE